MSQQMLSPPRCDVEGLSCRHKLSSTESDSTWSPGSSNRAVESSSQPGLDSSDAATISEERGNTLATVPSPCCIPRFTLTTSSTESLVAGSKLSPCRFGARAAQHKLAKGIHKASRKIGDSHPYVEEAKAKLKSMRKLEEHNRWSTVVAWHEESVVDAVHAVEDGEPEHQLLCAIRLAQQSELGPGHPVVIWGKEQLMRLRKGSRRADHRHLEDEHIQLLSAASVASSRGDHAALLDAINAASKDLGSSHPVVETAVLVYKQQRNETQRQFLDDLMNEHRVSIEEAHEMRNSKAMRKRIFSAASVLGWSNSVVTDGQRKLLDMINALNAARAAATQSECYENLKTLAYNAEVALSELMQGNIKSGNLANDDDVESQDPDELTESSGLALVRC